MAEPLLRVGLATGRAEAALTLEGAFSLEVDGNPGPALDGPVSVTVAGDVLALRAGEGTWRGARLRLVPAGDARFVLHGMTVGIAFHWEHDEDLRFEGAVALEAREGAFDVVNEVPLEAYLTSVIASEMSARCPPALLRAHAVVSRSWLLAQREGRGRGAPPPGTWTDAAGVLQVLRWYDREDHATFDVCADDHCQRYQGVSRAGPAAEAARAAVQATRGQVLMTPTGTCDARFSKCCGGVTERFDAAWGDDGPPCLEAVPDAPAGTPQPDLAVEDTARAFIEGRPPAFCATADRALLERLLPELDHVTRDFYRWEAVIPQAEARRLVTARLGVDPGPVAALRPLARGPSGRIVKLEIRGLDRRIHVGKELEIRRVLSPSHLYSSAFVVHPEGDDGGVPAAFRLRGAGWGHGVGLCQVGAAVMAEEGYDHPAILAHYYRGARLEQRY